MNTLYKDILQFVEHGTPVYIETSVSNNSGETISEMTKQIKAIDLSAESSSRCCVKVRTERSGNRTIISEPVFPPQRLIVLGAGHIAVPVCDFAAKLGFSVTVCDDRPSFASTQRFPLAKSVICDSFQNAIEALHITDYDYVVVITRGHRHDADCLRKILSGTYPAYLGMIGSRRRVKGLKEMLAGEGFPRSETEKIFTPIGLDIGAVTPEEIALSILAEIVCFKRKPESFGCTGYYTDSDLELDIIGCLVNCNEPKAIVTVIETKGSTPRAAGAKMAVTPLGRVFGSIGGGCSESEAIREALDIIGTGTYKILDIDLTGDVAESDGMVCGGIMRVLIEDDRAEET